MKKLTQGAVVARFRETHGNKYDYSKVEYRGTKVPVTVVCPLHGEFETTPGHHMAGIECPTCGRKKASDARRMGTDGFIEKARAVHGDTYDYSKVAYGRDNGDKVEIVCPEHGSFFQTPANHLCGKGCKGCADLRTGGAQSMTEQEFIEKALAVHGNAYDYSQINYRGTTRRVKIICPTHGPFEQIASNHIHQASGCPSCTTPGTSKLEAEVFEFVRSICPDAFAGDRTILGGKELDIVIPSKMVAVEFNGIWHHSTAFNQDRKYHQNKTDAAAAAGYRLIHIWSDEWILNREVIKGYLTNVLVGASRKIWARKCKIVPTTGAEQRTFLEANHLQGMGVGGSGCALVYEGEVVAVALRIRDELARWCVKIGVNVVGGLSRAMRWFNVKLLSYCDLAKHTGAGYLAAGWEDAGRTVNPQTFFVDGKRRISWQAGVALSGSFKRADTEAAGLFRLNGCQQRKFIWNP